MLKDASAETEFAGLSVELLQANDFRAGAPMQEGLSLYLYRVAVNVSRRNMPPSVGPDGERYRPAIPLDLYYLLTPWGQTAAKQHRLLGWAIRELQNMPVLPAALLNNYVPESATFRPTETVELIFESVSVQDMMNITDPIKLTQPLSIAYVARIVALESTVRLVEAGPVQTRVLDYGRAPEQ